MQKSSQNILLTTEIPALKNNKLIKEISKNYELYLFVLPTVIYYIIFKYIPMYGIQIAFKNFNASKGIFGSAWVGLTHFKTFFNSYYFAVILKNTISISIFQLAAAFPVPLLLALLLNQVENIRFKKTVQTVIYAPHFISTIIIVGLLQIFLSPRSGIINIALKALGFDAILFLADPKFFQPIYVLSGIWQNAGWGTVIYLAALAGINPELYEAAIVDGCNRWNRIIHIDIPGILPTVVTLLILECGKIMSVGFEKAFLLQNSMNLQTAEIISTYVYKVGLMNAKYSFSSAIGLFNSVINLIMLLIVNHISKKVSETSLW